MPIRRAAGSNRRYHFGCNPKRACIIHKINGKKFILFILKLVSITNYSVFLFYIGRLGLKETRANATSIMVHSCCDQRFRLMRFIEHSKQSRQSKSIKLRPSWRQCLAHCQQQLLAKKSPVVIRDWIVQLSDMKHRSERKTNITTKQCHRFAERTISWGLAHDEQLKVPAFELSLTST